MKKFSVIFFALVLALFCISCGSTTSKDDECNPDEEDCGETDTTHGEGTDTTDSGNPDNPDSGDADTTPGGDTDADTTNPDDSDTEPAGNGIITKIQKGEIAEKTEVTVPECVVTAVFYAEDEEHNKTAIKGVYVSEIIKKAQPYSGIYVFIKDTAAVDEYAIGDKLEVKGTYTEYHESSQIEISEIKKLGTADVPEAAVIADTSKIATPFEENEASAESCKWEPTANHGADAEAYESVLVKVEDVTVTNANICHGAFEVTGNLAIDKLLYYYPGKRNKGTEFGSITGILVYSYDAFRVAPRAESDYETVEDTTDSDTDTDTDTDTTVEFESTTIKAIQSGTVEQETAVKITKAIVISPVVTKTFSEGGKGYSFYVSDGNTGDYSGIYIYNATAGAAPAKGDEVTITGEVLLFKNKQWEIGSKNNVSCEMTKTGSGKTVPAVVEKTAASLKDSDKGTYVKITDELTVESVDDKGKVKFTNGLFAEGFGNVTFSPTAGNKVKISGIYDGVYGDLGIFIIDANDILLP